jgi:TolB-like protein
MVSEKEEIVVLPLQLSPFIPHFLYLAPKLLMEEIIVQVSSKVFKVLARESTYVIYDQGKRLDEIYFEDGKWSSKDRTDEYLVNRIGYAIEKKRKLK